MREAPSFEVRPFGWYGWMVSFDPARVSAPLGEYAGEVELFLANALDPAASRYVIPLRASSGNGCLVPSPRFLDFGDDPSGCGSKEGNVAFTDAELRSQMKENKPSSWYSLFTSGGTYLDAKFADDADAVQVGTVLEDTIDRRRLCGEGQFPLPAFLDAVAATGYRGAWGIEILSTEHRARDVESAARLSFDAARRFFPSPD